MVRVKNETDGSEYVQTELRNVTHTGPADTGLENTRLFFPFYHCDGSDNKACKTKK